MQLRRFEAPDSRAAMTLIREQLGEDATIISSETTASGVSVLAAIDYDPTLMATAPATSQKSDTPAKIPAPAAPASAVPATPALPVEIRQARARGQGGYGAHAVAKEAGGRGFGAVLRGVMEATTKGLRTLAPTRRPDASAAPALQLAGGTDTVEPAVNRMRDELGSMRKMIQRELGQLSEDRMRSSPARAAAMDLLENFGCSGPMATRLAGKVDTSLPESGVTAMCRLLLEEEARVCSADVLEQGGVIALVGPTGAGKTTTAAKLAARYAAKRGTRDVALVTVDQHRAAAREQLQAHGRRLGITVVEADGPGALGEVLKQLRDYPLVIIDTAGLSPRDKALSSHLNQLRELTSLRSLLVVPANGNGKDLSDVTKAYQVLRPEALVLTKVDETPRLGGAIDCSIAYDLPIAFVGNGQAVPNDLVRATPSLLSVGLEHLSRPAETSNALDHEAA